MSWKLTTRQEKIVPSSKPSESPEQILTLTLNPSQQATLKRLDAELTEAAQAAARPFQERINGYLMGVMEEKNLKGNWTYDPPTFTFYRPEALPQSKQKAE